jgi:FixJ family two-component response regulator
MPKLSGTDAKKYLQALGANIPFVFVSANPDFTMRGLGVCVSKADLLSNLNTEVRSTISERAICGQGRHLTCGTTSDFKESR